jgi:metal-responsive CopG/Arc/MetJ family transcriptional regulator
MNRCGAENEINRSEAIRRLVEAGAQGRAGKQGETRMRDDGMSINVRLRSDQLATLDRWIEGLSGAKLSRGEAIRRLIDLGLSHVSPDGQLSHEARAHATAMAAKVVDQLTDSTAPEEEQQKRKRKLIHGPREFRDVRKDQHHGNAPAAKGKP